jgi:hypothetical protein
MFLISLVSHGYIRSLLFLIAGVHVYQRFEGISLSNDAMLSWDLYND